MRKYLSILLGCELFAGLNEQEIYSVCSCLNSAVRHFKRGTIAYAEGDLVNSVCVVLEGELQLNKVDMLGNVNVVARIFSGDVALASSCYAKKPLQFDVCATADCSVLVLSAGNLFRTCCSACGCHARLIENMLRIIALKNVQLAEKIVVLSKRSIREKVLAYKQFNKGSISQTQLADYLSVDRSALARELGKMRREEEGKV